MLTIRTKCLESFLEAAQQMLPASSGVTRLYFSSHEKKFDLWEWLNKENVKSDPWSTRTRKHQLSCGRGMSLSLGSEARAEFSTLGSSRLSLGVLILLDKSSGSKNGLVPSLDWSTPMDHEPIFQRIPGRKFTLIWASQQSQHALFF